MKIIVVGAGYVGLVTGACLASLGHQVTFVDSDQNKIASLNAGIVPIYEAGLEESLTKYIHSGDVKFINNIQSAPPLVEAVFITVPTPCGEDGAADLRYVEECAKEIAASLSTSFVAIVIKSTVPLGTNQYIGDIIRSVNPHANFAMVSNPEFLRQGTAIKDFMQADRIVVGSKSSQAIAIMDKLYKPLVMQGIPFIQTDLFSAELAKYAANTFLATKISFINEIADLCEASGANIEDVARAIGLDKRIGLDFLKAGPGYGGSCLPKDASAFVRIAKQFNVSCEIVESTISVNSARKKSILGKVVQELGNDLRGKKIAVLGMTFKKNTDDIRESPGLALAHALLRLGAEVRVYDPKSMQDQLVGLLHTNSAYEALQGSYLGLILTDWDEFQQLNLQALKSSMQSPVIMDFHNLYNPSVMQANNIRYISVGRATV